MTLRMLGQSDLRITPIGIGAWAIGGGTWEFGWGPQDDSESVAAIHAGLDLGMNWIDTAAAYGHRDVESSILPFTLEHKIGVIVYSPMASGLLSGAMTRERIAALPQDDWRKHSPNFQEPLLSRNLLLVEKLRAVGQRYNASPGEVAIAWTLRNPAVTGAIIGIRSVQQAEGVAGAAELRFSAEDMRDLEQVVSLQAA